MSQDIEIAHVNLYLPDRDLWEERRIIYIGRQLHRRDLPHSLWANQFKLSDNATLAERQENLRNYARQFATQALRVKSLPKLLGSTLVCWCGGTSLCHGHFLAAAAFLVPTQARAEWQSACERAAEYAIAEHRVRRSGKPLRPTLETIEQYCGKVPA